MTIREITILITIALAIISFGGLFAMILSSKSPEAPPATTREDVQNRFMEE